MEILIVRHGQSQADLEDRHEGRGDFPLTKLGHQQARKLAQWISKNYPLDKIISSPLIRAATTAQYIGKTTGTEIVYEDDLMEWNNGLLAGVLRKEAEEKFPLPKGGRLPHDEFYDTESLINFRARGEGFLSKFLASNDDQKYQRICIVSHGGMINMLFRSFMRFPMDTDTWISTGDTGVHLWKMQGTKRGVLYTNRMDHLIER